jgi:branched-chain amino acid transport system permease protein
MRTDLATLGAIALVAVLIPFAFRDAAMLSILAVMFIYMSVNVSWNWVLGLAGTFSFAQVAFFSVGAYVAAILNVHEGVSPWVDTGVAAFAGGAASLLLGLAILRVRGVYVALVTLAFHQLLSTLVSTDYSGLTGGPNGLTTIAPYVATTSLLGQSLVGYWIGLLAAVATVILSFSIVRAPVGLAVVAARDAEHVAGARGINARTYRLVVFVLSGGVAGAMGAVYAHYVGVVSPSLFDFGILMMLLSMIIVGGWGTVWGPVLGTILLTLLTQYVQGRWPAYQSLILAIVLVVAVMFLRGGVAAVIASAARRGRRYWESLD